MFDDKVMIRAKNDRVQSCLDMGQYNIKMRVVTNHNELCDMIDKMRKLPLSQLRSMYKRVYANAKSADEYFEQFPMLANMNSKRYQNLCDDCAILACLGYLVKDKPMTFVHPDDVAKSFNNTRFPNVKIDTNDVAVVDDIKRESIFSFAKRKITDVLTQKDISK